MAKLIWLADVLRNAALKVEEVKGWQKRGGHMGDIKGVLLHHTAGPIGGNMPSLQTVKDGRPGLKGPLAQLALGRDGTWYVIAAGRSNHAGLGNWKGLTSGNRFLIGVEAENTGLPNDPWPQKQYDSYVKGVGAILDFLHLPAYCAIGHKEWAPRRKIDPSFDMNVFREKLGEDMARKKKIEKDVVEDFYVPIIDEPVWKEVQEDMEEEVLELQPEEELKAARKKMSPKQILEDLGWKDYQAAALLAQAVVESNMNPNATTYTVNKHPATRENPLAQVTTYGIMNWNSGRLDNLDKFVRMWNKGHRGTKEKNDLDIQVRFIDWELRNSEKEAAKQLRDSTDMMEALRAATGYVRPSGWSVDTPESSKSWDKRVVAAYGLMNE